MRHCGWVVATAQAKRYRIGVCWTGGHRRLHHPRCCLSAAVFGLRVGFALDRECGRAGRRAKGKGDDGWNFGPGSTPDGKDARRDHPTGQTGRLTRASVLSNPLAIRPSLSVVHSHTGSGVSKYSAPTAVTATRQRILAPSTVRSRIPSRATWEISAIASNSVATLRMVLGKGGKSCHAPSISYRKGVLLPSSGGGPKANAVAPSTCAMHSARTISFLTGSVSPTSKSKSGSMVSSTTNIGYPKLFIGGAVGRQVAPAAPPVNNFVAAQKFAARFGWCGLWVFTIRVSRFTRPGGSGLLTTTRPNDFELRDRPVGRGLTLHDSSRGRCSILHDDFSILPSSGQAHGTPKKREAPAVVHWKCACN